LLSSESISESLLAVSPDTTTLFALQESFNALTTEPSEGCLVTDREGDLVEGDLEEGLLEEGRLVEGLSVGILGLMVGRLVVVLSVFSLAGEARDRGSISIVMDDDEGCKIDAIAEGVLPCATPACA
jgi:hypothetical protein